jgi:hypothetical protein
MAASIPQNWAPTAYGTPTNTASATSPIGSSSAVAVWAFAQGGTPTDGVSNFTVTVAGAAATFAVGHVEGIQNGELYYVANVTSGTMPSVSVTANAGQAQSFGTQFIASEIGGVSTTSPFVQFSAATNVFVLLLNSGPVNSTSGNLLMGSATDSFAGLIEGSFSSGSTNAGVGSGYSAGVGWSGDWQVSAGGSISYTDNGSGGFAISVISEWAASGGPPPATKPFDVIFYSMNF